MIPYPRELLLNSPNNYGIVRTETVYGFGSDFFENTSSTTEPFVWARNDGETKGRYLNDAEFVDSRSKKRKPKSKTDTKNVAKDKKSGKKHKKRKSKGVKKCFLKLMKQSKKRRKSMMSKKYMVPLILGLLAAKSLLIPAALKGLAFLSAKGLMMGFFATVLASMLSLKNLFVNSHGYQNRKDDSKTQVEIIQVPSYDDHYYHNNDHYRRDDYDPEIPYVLLRHPGNVRMAPSENVWLEPYGNVRLAPSENVRLEPYGYVSLAPSENVRLEPYGNVRLASSEKVSLAPRENEVPVKNRRRRQ